MYTAADFELDERHVIKNEKVVLDRLQVGQNVFLVLSINFLIVAVKAHLADENETGLGISELGECHWF